MIASTSALASSERRRSFEPIRCAAWRASTVVSSKSVRGAIPAAWIRTTRPAALVMPRTIRPESVGYLMSAGTTVVSARNQSISITPASTALATSAALSCSTSSGPQRVVIFISVERCGAGCPIGMRAKRSHDNESVTSAQSVS